METSNQVVATVKRKSIVRTWHRAMAMCLLIAGYCMPIYAVDPNTSGQPSVEVIVEKMQAANLQRAEALLGYSGRRVYKVDYRGFPSGRHAEMIVEAVYTFPAQKDFRIVSESGSKLLLQHVLYRLLDSEKEALQNANRKQTAMSTENYTFRFVDTEQGAEGKLYVLQVEPKIKNKFLYRGTIWVDAADFAVARIEGKPAKNPSWWISSTEIHHRYSKVDRFWLPVHNESVTHVRVGGQAVLTIEYTEYKIKTATAAASVRSSSAEP
jgi:hypothetical protein